MTSNFLISLVKYEVKKNYKMLKWEKNKRWKICVRQIQVVSDHRIVQ